VTRENEKMQIRDTQSGTETYDQVVMAAHGDEILALLKDASAAAMPPSPGSLPSKASRQPVRGRPSGP
jgi:hypothetical protein